MKKKRTKLVKELIYIQPYHVYPNELLVLVNVKDKKKVYQFLKKNRVIPKVAEWILRDFDIWKEVLQTNTALFAFSRELGTTAMVLKEPQDDWGYWETLMHETHHAVFHVAEQKMFTKETEAQVYLFEYLFHSIRRKISGFND